MTAKEKNLKVGKLYRNAYGEIVIIEEIRARQVYFWVLGERYPDHLPSVPIVVSITYWKEL